AQRACDRSLSTYPQTYPQLFVDIAISTTGCFRARPREHAGARVAALQKLAAARSFGLQSAPAATITTRKRVVRDHPGRRLADLVPAPRFRHRRCPDHRALDLVALEKDHPADAARAGGRRLSAPGAVARGDR